MLSVFPQPSAAHLPVAAATLPPSTTRDALLQKHDSLDDALQPFVNYIITSMGQPRTVKLYCALPTWSSPSDIGLDLHDLHDLHSRSLTFIHDLTRALRAAKIQATYSITPFHSTFALIRAFPPGVECKCDTNAQCRETLQAQTNEQEKAYIAEWHGLPALIIT